MVSKTSMLLAMAAASANSLMDDRDYMRMTRQGFTNSTKSVKTRNSEAKSKRAKDKKSKASRKANRKK